MNKITKTLFSVLTMLVFMLNAQEPPKIYNLEAKIPIDTTVVRGELKNGLKYYIKQNNKPKNMVYIRLVVKAGVMQEDDKQMGLAHLLEHMGFNGTKNFKKNKLISYLESIGMSFGADLNAHTGLEETVYKLQVPSKNIKNVDTAFQIIEDWAHNMLLDTQEIDAERPVVLEEFRARKGSRQRVNKLAAKFIYAGMPQLKYFSDKKIDNIKNFMPKHMQRYYNSWYRPNLMGIVVAGDIDVNYAKQKIEAHFSSLTNPKNEKPIIKNDSVPYHANTRIKIITDPELTTTSISLRILDKHPDLEDRTRIKAQKKAIMLNTMASIINRRLKELSSSNTPPFISARVGVAPTISSKHYQFYAGVSTSDTDINKSLKALFLELERIKRFGITDLELERVKKSMLASNDTFLEQKNDWKSKKYLSILEQEYKSFGVLYNKSWLYKFKKDIIQQITKQDLERLYANYYRQDNRVVLVKTAAKSNVVLPTEQELQEVITQAETKPDLVAYIANTVNQELVKNIRPQGRIVKQENLLHNIQHFVLSNGMEVYCKKTDFNKKSVIFKSFSYGGKSLMSNQDAKTVAPIMGVTRATGAGGYKPEDMSKVLNGKKVSVKTVVSQYHEGVNGSARVKDLETMFKLIYLNFTSQNLDSLTYATRVNKIKTANKNRQLSPKSIFGNAINNAVNQGNPRYVNVNETNKLEQLLDSVPYSKLHKYYSSRFKNAGDFKFFIVGDFDTATLKTYIETYLASLPSTPQRENYKLHDFKSHLKNEKLTVRAGLENKATLLIRFNTYAKHIRKEEQALSIFGKIYKNRLRNKIREEQGGAYSVSAGLKHVPRPHSKYQAYVAFNCAPDNIETLEQESLKVLKLLLKHGPKEKEVASIKKNLILNREKALQTNRFWKNYMYKTIYNKKDFKSLNNYKSSLDVLTVKYIKNTAKKYVKQPSLTVKLLPNSIK